MYQVFKLGKLPKIIHFIGCTCIYRWEFCTLLLRQYQWEHAMIFSCCGCIENLNAFLMFILVTYLQLCTSCVLTNCCMCEVNKKLACFYTIWHILFHFLKKKQRNHRFEYVTITISLLWLGFLISWAWVCYNAFSHGLPLIWGKFVIQNWWFHNRR